MKTVFSFGLILILIFSCAPKFHLYKEVKVKQKKLNHVEIVQVYEHKNLGARALEVLNDKVYFAGRNGWVGIYDAKNQSVQTHQIDSTLEFRSMALLPTFYLGGPMGEPVEIYLMNIGSPAYMFHGKEINQLKQELISDHPNAFFDAMNLDVSGFGIIMGDPIDSCMSVLEINNKYELKWMNCNAFPKTIQGEAAFAASDTNIEMISDNIWIASGGVRSRIYKSTNYGSSWNVYETPIIQGKPTTGIYSIDFYDFNVGVAMGGDYTNPTANYRNLIKTEDGGETWKVISSENSPGYRSCIQFIPGYKGKGMVAVGFQGIDISIDGGENWQHISDLNVYTIRFLNHEKAYVAGKDGVYELVFSEL